MRRSPLVAARGVPVGKLRSVADSPTGNQSERAIAVAQSLTDPTRSVSEASGADPVDRRVPPLLTLRVSMVAATAFVCNSWENRLSAVSRRIRIRECVSRSLVSPANQTNARWWSGQRPLGLWIGPTLLGLIGLVFIHHPMLLSGLEQIQTDTGDSRLINYLLEHSYRWIAGDSAHRRFWDVPIFYPARNVAAYSDTLLSTAPVYWLWRTFGLLPDTSFQFWMMSVSAINYVAGYWLLRSGFRRGTLGSCCGAFLFAFGASRTSQLEHQQLLPQVYTVVVLMALLRVFGGRPCSLSRSVALWVIGGLSLAAQFYASFYLGWFLVLALGLASLLVTVRAQSRSVLLAVIRHQWPAIALAAAVSSLAIYPLLAHYLEAAKQVGMRGDIEIMLSVPDWRTWVYEGPHSWIWGWLCRLARFHFRSLEQAHRMGIGAVTPLVCVVGLLSRWREPAVRLIALTGLSMLIVLTHFQREIWEGAGLGWWAVGAAELLRPSRVAAHRQVAGGLTALLGLTLFPATTLAMAVLLAALPYGASRLLTDRSRPLLQALVPTILIGFPFATAYAHRPLAQAIGVVVATLIEIWAWRAGRSQTLRTLIIGSVVITGSLWVFQYDIIYWRIVVDVVPAARVLRAVSRGLLLCLIPASLGLACFFDEIRARPLNVAAACALGLACLLEQGVTSPTFDKSVRRAATSEVARQVDRHCTSFYYSPHNSEAPLYQEHLDAMWAQIETGVPTINGYTGASPPGWLPLYESNVNSEMDIDRIGRALDQWAERNRLERETICWIGGRNDAIVSSGTAPDDRQPGTKPR
jgi:hypothetical protein